MKFEFSPELEAYRAEVRAFVAEHSPGIRPHTGVRAPEPDQVPAIRAWIARLYAAGYLGQSWPVEHGGRPEARPEHGFIVAEELARARAWGEIGAGALASGALLAFGTPEQKARFLPRIRSGADLWCQMFSEPEAGSDLAALRTKARLEGDHYVVDGQKVWTTNGHHADMGYLLARTNQDTAKQAGITAFVVDMRTPGIDVRPLREITGTNDFNEVFLENVRIPADQVIGKVDDGWRVANVSLGHERSGVGARAVELYAQLDDLVELARRTTVRGRPALEDAATRQRLGRLATRVHVTDMMSKAVKSRIVGGTEDAADAPLAKVFYSEVNLAAAELGVELQGVDGLAVEGDPHAYADGWWQDAFLYSRAYTIAGGANEVLKTVVAERALGLPRDKR
ncbi:alkylation response protein AidB-like acyl-CoA dehydrogenase [Actinocorallia herbida]|uniref:Alkylation response protein AidB-like acyl-CoA dehydrogenase n=1 Tax=Actinocorallia herbida TaxID=58109 RepID=A0A3N1D323_9ACTN|nr:acyl-CoA dehydrogenase family protein [Actinocorallia herbida]ROO87458.1 alkylation response protein AidB-like acyl-CoA dehydrogenase [Actinocorallia herbida]